MNNLIDTFANRLKIAIKIRNIKPIKLSEKTGIDKSKISSYMSGRYKAKQDGIYLLANALDVNEIWLMGYDIPMERNISAPIQEENNNSINTEGLTVEEIEEIKEFIRFKKSLKIKKD